MTLEERVMAILGSDGFWKTHTLSDDDIIDILEKLWYAVSNEYA